MKSLAYLSGAPRVSTRPEAGAAGPRTHVLGVMNAFRRLGWEVRPYIVGDRVPLEWVVGGASERTLRRSPLKRIAADLARLCLGAIHGPRALREIGQVDWVYERYGAFQALGWWFQRQGIPWILETNAVLYREATQDRSTVALPALLKRVEQWAYRKCDVLVCISQALAELVIEETGIPKEKIIILPNGVDTEHLNPDRVEARRFFEGPTLGFVGGLAPWQRLDLLIDVLAALREDGVQYNLVVVGDGPMREAWEARAQGKGMGDQVRFVGQVPWEEVPAYIAGFDLGYAGAVPLAAGKMYLSPLKLYEYVAMGRPFVASAYDDARRLIADGAVGYLFEPGNPEDLKRVLRVAYDERSGWTVMGRRSREVVKQKHSWEARVQTLISQVEAILASQNEATDHTRR